MTTRRELGSLSLVVSKLADSRYPSDMSWRWPLFLWLLCAIGCGDDSTDETSPVDSGTPSDGDAPIDGSEDSGVPDALHADFLWSVAGDDPEHSRWDFDGYEITTSRGVWHRLAGMAATQLEGPETFLGWGTAQPHRWHHFLPYFERGVAFSDTGALVLADATESFDGTALSVPAIIWNPPEGDAVRFDLPAGMSIDAVWSSDGEAVIVRGEAESLAGLGITPRGTSGGHFVAQVDPDGFRWVTGLGETTAAFLLEAALADDESLWVTWPTSQELLGETVPVATDFALVRIDSEQGTLIDAWPLVANNPRLRDTDGEIQLTFDVDRETGVATVGEHDYSLHPVSSRGYVRATWDGRSAPTRGTRYPDRVEPAGWWPAPGSSVSAPTELTDGGIIGSGAQAVLAYFADDGNADWVLTSDLPGVPRPPSAATAADVRLLTLGILSGERTLGERVLEPAPEGHRDLYVVLYDESGAIVREVRVEFPQGVQSYVLDASEEYLLLFWDALGPEGVPVEFVIEQRRWDGTLVDTLPIEIADHSCPGPGFFVPQVLRSYRNGERWTRSTVSIRAYCPGTHEDGSHTVRVGSVEESFPVFNSETVVNLALVP